MCLWITKKVNVRNPDFDRKRKVIFFRKIRARANGSKIFWWYNQKIRKNEFFKFFRVRFEREVSESRKMWKTKVLNYDLGEKFHFFWTACSRHRRFFCGYNTRMYKEEFFKSVRVRFEEQVSEARKNWNTNV